MTTDILSSDQTHQYFLEDAVILLQTMDDELQDLRDTFSVQKVHTLMRAAHTLKGAAASVGLDAIKTTTHSLEDIFKSICRQDTVISVELETLIFQSYDCLKLLLSAQLVGAQVDEADILDRMASTVTDLQVMLGDRFGQGGDLPTSSELGFDMTQSIFELGVAERIVALEVALEKPDSEELLAILKSQGEVFVGLAESLGLPGFRQIAACLLCALEENPDRVVEIAPVALANYKSAQSLVLSGDRTQGGEPSPALRKFCTVSENLSQSEVAPAERNNLRIAPAVSTVLQKLWLCLRQNISQPASLQRSPDRPLSALDEAIEAPLLDSYSSQTISETTPDISSLDESEEEEQRLRQDLTGDDDDDEQRLSQDLADDEGSDETDLADLSLFHMAEFPQEPVLVETAAVVKSTVNHDATIRVKIKDIEQLNQDMGELLTYHNRLVLHNAQLSTLTEALLNQSSQHRKQWTQSLLKMNRQVSKSMPLFACSLHDRTDSSSVHANAYAHFDTLELERYSDSQLIAQSVLEEAAQQKKSLEAIESLLGQSKIAFEKQRQLLAGARKTLLSARMLPLDTIFKRFPSALERLKKQHSKQVVLTMMGGEVLVDKVIIDKLYEPLLHLIRNAFDHGIEFPEHRQNKPIVGEIKLEARQQGRYLEIQVSDDGYGLNFDKIRQKAVDTQIITAEDAQQLSSEQTIDLLFQAGFSTAGNLDELSGRGVGLDAVQAQVRSLQGWITVSHNPGRGTCFTLHIPSTLTISKLLLCKAEDRVYALVPDAVEHILMLTRESLPAGKSVRTILYRSNEAEHWVPIYALSDILHYETPDPHHQHRKAPTSPTVPVILLNYKDELIGIEVDQLLDEQEMVISTLEKTIVPPAYLSGSSILPDGRLTLVLDGMMLAKTVIEKVSKLTIQNNLQPVDTPDSGSHFDQQVIKRDRAVARPANRKQLILTVDDSITVRNTLAEQLQKAGYQVLQAKDGIEALEQLKRYPEIAAILCDIEMPRMNGFEFLKARQQSPEIAEIPTIMLTSREGSKHRLLAQELGATDYLTKHYLTADLLKAIADALGEAAFQQPQQLTLQGNAV